MPTLIQHPDAVARQKMWSRQSHASNAAGEVDTRASDPQENPAEEAPKDGNFLEVQLR